MGVLPPRRGRFAPSPTGHLHFGSLVAALASHADARHAGAEWHLRIEDVDVPRVRRGAADAILRDLERLGFAWDGPVWTQSKRVDAYAAALETLHAAGLVYRCRCTRRELAHARRNAQGEPVYPGHCRLDPTRAAGSRDAIAWRIRVPAGPTTIVDRHYGLQCQDLAAEVGDFVVRRSDGMFAYQLAVVVDDAAQGITDVVRGADLLASTPRQVFLQSSLGLPTPRYLHVPVAVDRAGAKLSKHLGARALADDPLDALVAAWRFLGQEEPPDHPASIGDFWAFARSRWMVGRLPSTLVQVAPEFPLAGTET
ncbi:MAG TPA: tRNA glutamyl-Q(34) synthetase GluQRS [Casimicrobiaceae bacterium]|jgi:glutamyl-Q tRNA(Asp) synthetase